MFLCAPSWPDISIGVVSCKILNHVDIDRPQTSMVWVVWAEKRRPCPGGWWWQKYIVRMSLEECHPLTCQSLQSSSTLFARKQSFLLSPGAWRSPCRHFGSQDVTSHSWTWITCPIVWIFLSSNVCILLIYLFVIYSLSLLGVSLRELGIPWNACIWSYVEWGNLSSMPCWLF